MGFRRHLEENPYFCSMNGDSFYILLLCFVSGLTQWALIGCGIFMLMYHRTYQFQRVFASVLFLHSIGFFNNFVVLACRNQPYSEFLNTLLVLFDYVIVGGYMMFAVSLVFPNRFKLRKLMLIAIPYLIAVLLFAITRSELVMPAVNIYTIVATLFLLVYLGFSIRKHTRMLRDNVGNMEFFDLRWTKNLIAIYFVFFLFWVVESTSQQSWFTTSSTENNLTIDSIYCIFTIAVVHLVALRISRQKVFVVSEEENEGSVDAIEQNYTPIYQSLIDSNIDSIIVEKRYYQDNSLTLQKLAQHLGTNRQYLSNYINQEKHQTFYDYINDFRLEEVRVLMEDKGTENQHSLEDISLMAGFNSYSTFLRSFKKKYGQTPSQYLAGKA